MSRKPVHVRDAVPEDAPALLKVWAEIRRSPLARVGAGPDEAEAANALARIAADSDERLLVGLIENDVVGVAHLLRASMSPIHAESAIHITHLHVVGGQRRHGVGKALIEAAVTWAEEKNTDYILAAASAHSRDANRFMARLGLSQIATVRGATVPALRARMPVEPPAGAMVSSRNHRSVGHVLAQRRLQRRVQARAE